MPAQEIKNPYIFVYRINNVEVVVIFQEMFLYFLKNLKKYTFKKVAASEDDD